MNPDRDLINFLAQQYSGFREAQQLWKNAGGNPAHVHDQENPRTRWGLLIERMNAGAIQPIDLILNALEEFPGSPILLRALARHVPSEARVIARETLNTLSQHTPTDPETANTTFAPLELLPPRVATAAIAAELNEAPQETQEKAQTFFEFAREKILETVIQEGVKIALLAIPLVHAVANGN